MSNLAALLEGLATDAKVVGTDDSRSVKQFMALATEYRKAYHNLKNRPLALVYTNTKSFIVGLLAFDGYSSALYLCSDALVDTLDPQIMRLKIDIADSPIISTGSEVANNASYAENNSTSTSSIHKAELISAEQEMNTAQQQHNLELNKKHESSQSIDTQWYLASSGTTGQPKWFAHTLTSLTRTTKSSSTFSSLRWANMYQPYRYAGLQVLLQVLISGAVLLDDDTEDLFLKIQGCIAARVNAISATPSMWRKMLMTNKMHQMPLRRITLGGEIVDQSLLDKLTELYPNACIRHIYASTEAGVGFVVADKLAGFPIRWLQQGVGNTQLAVDENSHLRIKPKHRLGAQLSALVDCDGYLDTQDRVRIECDRVYFLGRASGVINVGGNKVHPENVESVILSVEGVCQAKVYGQSNSVLGNLVAADIAIEPHQDWVKVSQAIRLQCKLLLQRFEIPVKLRQIDSLVVSPTGKLNRSDDNV
jgi:acyl-CoA synthetase (AMP-forming)/AMP-acid ligase II